ncbi:MAG: IgGFc-binding protein [Candidatus Kapabacteria bacterium]|nr:IgGFc-binding protein [Ignavibacteriota bacterium]MCW5883527.1 IgGFc-binding protein [Candidatus Kapabacteria bacterium]
MELKFKQPVGTEFWLTFMMNFRDDSSSPKNALNLELFITGDKDASVLIECPAINYTETLFVPGGTVRSILLTDKVMIKSFEIIERKLAVRISSDNPVSVYGLNRRYQTTDTYLGLPVQVLGDEYRVMCYHVAEELSPLFSIVATEDNTLVTITPNALTFKGKKKNEAFDITLNKGDVYQVRSETNRMQLRQLKISEREIDLTGSHIKANKNIAVFSGHECTYVPVGPPRIKACNHIVEQLPPVSSWGKHFYIGKLKGRSTFTYRVLAHTDGTRVFENSKLIATLKAGDFVEKNINEAIQITADQPVLVSQYSQGYENGDQIGDPMMLLISPTQQFLTQYRFATPVNGSWNHYVNVVVPTRAIQTFELNGKKVDPKIFEPLGISRYSIAYLQVPFGTHFIKANEPFGMYSYGFGFGDVDAYDAYGNMGGQSFLEYVQVSDTIPPTVDLKKVEGKQNMILRDDRADDLGLKSFNIIDSTGIKINHNKIMDGMLQLPVDIEPVDYNTPGQLYFEVGDISGNKAEYTLCWTIDEITGQYEFVLNPGYIKSCVPEPGFVIGAFGRYSIVTHSTGFSKSGNIAVPGNFESASGGGGIAGLYLSKKVMPKLNLSARLSIEQFGGTIEAPDSIISSRRDPQTGGLLPFQETHYLELNSSFITLSLAGEYSLARFISGVAGVNLSVRMNNSIELRRAITIPDNFVYANGENQITLSEFDNMTSLTAFRFGLFGGLGASIPVYQRFSGFIETTYNFYPMDIINDGDWKINNLSFILGVKYQL